MEQREFAVSFHCENTLLYGIIHSPAVASTTGVLIIVGGPQYRVGSHRQFILLARDLMAQGYSCMRFDYRGMGDSCGQSRDFETIHEDIKSAIDEFLRRSPRLQRVILWGLCDAATAAIFYAHQDQRVAGLVLLNPWVNTSQGQAKAYLKYYYLRRFLDKDWWKKIGAGQFNLFKSLRSLFGNLSMAVSVSTQSTSPSRNSDLPQRVWQGWKRFSGPILLILSGNDLVAAEFKETIKASHWRKLLAQNKIQRHDLLEANHTFASAAWRDQVSAWTVAWLKQIETS